MRTKKSVMLLSAISIVAMLGVATPASGQNRKHEGQVQQLNADNFAAANAEYNRLLELTAENPQLYAGVSYDASANSGSGVVVLNTHFSGSERPASDYSANVERSMSALRAAGVTVSMVDRPHSLSDLRRTMSEVEVSQIFQTPAGNLRSYGIDPDSNSVSVGLRQITVGIRAQAREEFGSRVTLHTTDVEPETISDIRWTDSAPPFYGSTEIVGPPQGLDHLRPFCTAGFSAYSSSHTQYALTAGHCGKVGWKYNVGGGLNPVGVSFGTMTANSYKPSPSPTVDAAAIRGSTYAGYIWTNKLESRAESTAVTGHAAVGKGASVRLDGSQSGPVTGTVTTYPECIIDKNGAHTCNIVGVHTQSSACVGGDSGGPVWYSDLHSGAIAVGILVLGQGGTTCFYTEIGQILSQYKLSITLGTP